MSIAVKINTQNQQKVRTLTPVALTSITQLSDISVIDASNNSTLVYNTVTSKYEVKTLPIIYGGTF